jgi:hypothetical protein
LSVALAGWSLVARVERGARQPLHPNAVAALGSQRRRVAPGRTPLGLVVAAAEYPMAAVPRWLRFEDRQSRATPLASLCRSIAAVAGGSVLQNNRYNPPLGSFC